MCLFLLRPWTLFCRNRTDSHQMFHICLYQGYSQGSLLLRTKPRQALEQASRQGSGCVCVQVFQKVQQSMDIKSSSQVHRRERCAEHHGAQAVGSGSYREQGIEDSTVTETTQCAIIGIPSGTSDGDGWVHGSDITLSSVTGHQASPTERSSYNRVLKYSAHTIRDRQVY